MKQEPLKSSTEIPSKVQSGIEYNSKKYYLTNTLKTKIWVAVAIFIVLILHALGGFMLGRYYEKSINKNTPSDMIPQIEKLNNFIQDTSADHEYNTIKAQVNTINEKLDFKLKKQLNEIKNNTGMHWNIVRNDSLFNAWRQFEAEYE